MKFCSEMNSSIKNQMNRVQKTCFKLHLIDTKLIKNYSLLSAFAAFCCFISVNCEKELQYLRQNEQGKYIFSYDGTEHIKSTGFYELFESNPEAAKVSFLNKLSSSTGSAQRSERSLPDKRERQQEKFRSSDFHDYDGYGGGFSGRNPSREAQATPCPQPTKSDSFCRPIPNARDNFRGDRGVTEFAWKLFKNSDTQANYALSPLSPQILLSYLAWVANGTTKSELVEANGYDSPQSIERTISSLTRHQSPDKPRELLISTAFFVSKDMRYVYSMFSCSYMHINTDRQTYIHTQ